MCFLSAERASEISASVLLLLHSNQPISSREFTQVIKYIFPYYVIILLLFATGIPIDYVMRSGWTALMHAAREASDNVVELLLDRGANANYQKGQFNFN